MWLALVRRNDFFTINVGEADGAGCIRRDLDIHQTTEDSNEDTLGNEQTLGDEDSVSPVPRNAVDVHYAPKIEPGTSSAPQNEKATKIKKRELQEEGDSVAGSSSSVGMKESENRDRVVDSRMMNEDFELSEELGEIRRYRGGVHKEKTIKYLIVLTYLFVAGYFLIDLFCLSTAFHCYTDVYLHEYSVMSIFHLLRLIFVAIQVIFLQVFVSALIKTKQKKMKFLLSHLIGTNISIWMTTFFQVSGILKGDKTSNIWEFSELNCTMIDKPYFNIAKQVESYLNPFILEFSLLCVTLLIDIYPRNSDVAKERHRGIEKKRKPSQEYLCSPGLVCGFIWATPVVISAVCISYHQLYYSYDVLFNYIVSILSAIFTVCISFNIVHELRKNHHVDDIMNKTDLVMLYATALFGFVPYHFFVMLSIFLIGTKTIQPKDAPFLAPEALAHYNHNITLIKVVTFCQSLSNMVSVVYQTTKISEAHSYKRKWYNVNDGAEKKLSAAKIKQWLLILFMINVALWVSDSFFEFKRKPGETYLITYEVFGRGSFLWFVIVNICLPITIFYRIHAAAMIIHIWFKFS